MKKWVFGCLGLAVVIAIGSGYAAYHFLYKPAREYAASFQQFKVVPELNARIESRGTFTPPPGGIITEASVQRVMRIQAAVQGRLGERLRELEAKHEALRRDNGPPSFREAMAALKDLTGLFLDGKRAQVDALNTEQWSLAEYEWTRARIYEALGVPIDATLQYVISEASRGNIPDRDAAPGREPAPVPEKNRAVVAPHARELTDRAALVFFAL